MTADRAEACSKLAALASGVAYGATRFQPLLWAFFLLGVAALGLALWRGATREESHFSTARTALLAWALLGAVIFFVVFALSLSVALLAAAIRGDSVARALYAALRVGLLTSGLVVALVALEAGLRRLVGSRRPPR